VSQFTFRTSPPAIYISPSREEMKEAAAKVGLKGFAPDLVADMTNLAAGGRVRLPSEYRGEVERRVEEHLPAPDSHGEWSISARKDGKKTVAWTKNRQEAVVSRVDNTMRYHQNVCDFLQTLDLSRFPGTPRLSRPWPASNCFPKAGRGIEWRRRGWGRAAPHLRGL